MSGVRAASGIAARRRSKIGAMPPASCVKCGHRGDLFGLVRCPDCEEPLAQVDVSWAMPAGLCAGGRSELFLRVTARTDSRLRDLAVDLTSGPEYFEEGGTLSADRDLLGGRGASWDALLRICVRGDVYNALPFDLAVRYRDGHDDQWTFGASWTLYCATADTSAEHFNYHQHGDIDQMSVRGDNRIEPFPRPPTAGPGGPVEIPRPGDDDFKPIDLAVESVRPIAPRTITVGTVLEGRYRVTHQLSQAGHYSVVFRAVDLDTGEVYAIKALPRELAADPNALDTFRREARALRRLTHPRIVRLWDDHLYRGDAETVPYLRMEFLDGDSVLDRLRAEGGRLPVEQVLRIGVDACEALAHAHEKGVFHRDVKPANLMLTGRGRVKLADFNRAIDHELGRPGRLRRDGGVHVPRAAARRTAHPAARPVGPRGDPVRAPRRPPAVHRRCGCDHRPADGVRRRGGGDRGTARGFAGAGVRGDSAVHGAGAGGPVGGCEGVEGGADGVASTA